MTVKSGTKKQRVTNRKRKNEMDSEIRKILRCMDYCVRIGRDPYNPNEPLPKWLKEKRTLKVRERRRDALGRLLNNKPHF